MVDPVVASKETKPQLSRRLEIILLIVIIAGAIVARTVALRSVPPGFRYDELVNATGVDQVLREGPVIYFTSGWGHEPLFQHIAALIWALLGRSAVTFRLTAALFGVLGVFAGWLLARRLFGSWVALLSAAALATTYVPLQFGRVALRVIGLPFFTALTAYALWRAVEPESGRPGGKRAFGWFGLGGLTLGLGLITYPASRVLPAVLLAFVIYLAIFHRDWVRGRLLGLVLYFGLAALIAGPMFLFLVTNPEAEQRTQQLSLLLSESLAGEFQPLLEGAWNTVTMFLIRGDPEWLYNIAERPFFPLPVALLFIAGVGVAIWRWRSPAYMLILLLLVGGLIPGMFSSTDPGFSRTINILPVVFIFPALAVVGGVWWATQRWPKARSTILATAVALVLLYLAADSYAYFGVWASQPEAQESHGPEILQLAEYLEAHPEIEEGVVSSPGVTYYDPWDHVQMELLLGREARLRWFNGKTSLIIPVVNGPVHYFIRDNAPLAGVYEALNDDFKSERRETGSLPELPSFSIFSLDDPAQAAEQLLATAAPVEPVQFGRTVTFHGENGLKDSYSPGESIDFYTVWQAEEASDEPLVVFVHLLDQAGEWIAGWDQLDVTPSYWGKGDVFALGHALAIPDDVPVGRYQIRTGLYSPETGVRLPTDQGGDQILLREIRIDGTDS